MSVDHDATIGNSASCEHVDPLVLKVKTQGGKCNEKCAPKSNKRNNDDLTLEFLNYKDYPVVANTCDDVKFLKIVLL